MDYIKRMFSLEGQTVVITGGGGVLAGAVAEALLNAGAAVSLWGRSHESLDLAEEKLTRQTGMSGKIHKIVVDTGEEDAVSEALSATEEKTGLPQILINGVGGNMGKSLFIEIKHFAYSYNSIMTVHLYFLFHSNFPPLNDVGFLCKTNFVNYEC